MTTDALSQAIAKETSAAVLMSMRAWAIEEGRWHHETQYAAKLAELSERWK